MAAAERGKIGPVVGVGPLGRRRVVRRCEVVLNGPRELGEDRAAALERLDRGQRVPASAVSGDRAGLRAVRGRFPRLLLSKLVVVPVPEKGFSQARKRRYRVRQDAAARARYARTMPFRPLDELEDLEEIGLSRPLPLRRICRTKACRGTARSGGRHCLAAMRKPSGATAISTPSSLRRTGATRPPCATRRPVRLTRRGRSSRWRFGVGR